MAMTYEQSGALMDMNTPGGIAFRKRIKVSCLYYATYITNESNTTPAHSSRYRWAQHTGLQPEAVAIEMQPMVVMEDAVQTAGVDENGNALITDAALQSAVETVVNKFI